MKQHRNLIMVLVAVAALGMGWRYLQRALTSNEGEATWLYVREGLDAQALSDTLSARLPMEMARALETLLDEPGKLRTGAYFIEPGERAWRVARRINRNQQTPIRFTFTNLRSGAEFAGRLGRTLSADSAEVAAAMKQMAREDSITTEELSCQLLPDTYELYWSTPPAKAVEKVRANWKCFWNAERRARADSLGLTPEQVSIIASIVEGETWRQQEWARIARVYINRLKRNMPLQADPTVKFATGDFGARRVTPQMLAVESPYNTYRHTGLPPGPIRLPQASTLEAVLEAPATDDLYMCARADLSGYHDFSPDFATHTRRAAAYRSVLNARGIH